MPSCQDCRWWTQDWKGIAPNEGACMIARSEPDRDGHSRPVVTNTPMRAIGNDGHVAGTLITRRGFRCAAFAPR